MTIIAILPSPSLCFRHLIQLACYHSVTLRIGRIVSRMLRTQCTGFLLPLAFECIFDYESTSIRSYG